jgi:hypothetical protein
VVPTGEGDQPSPLGRVVRFPSWLMAGAEGSKGWAESRRGRRRPDQPRLVKKRTDLPPAPTQPPEVCPRPRQQSAPKRTEIATNPGRPLEPCPFHAPRRLRKPPARPVPRPRRPVVGPCVYIQFNDCPQRIVWTSDDNSSSSGDKGHQAHASALREDLSS